MIRTPTVFVLGAGASAPYGFPPGGELVKKIYQAFRPSPQTEKARAELRKCFPYSDAQIDLFLERLLDFQPLSIDAFLEQRDHDFGMIGRAMIAHTLMPLEKDDELNVIYNGGNALEDRHKRRWYHYLFNQMLTSGASLVDNRLSIITFNFDRSFERAFFRFVRGVHGGNEGTLNKICQSIKIEHIHGQLGAPNWLEASGGRRFGCAEVDPDELMHCAEAIRIAHQEIDPEVLKRARALIAEAKHVCFLGFSYHPLNLIKLDVSTIIGDGRNVVGTSFEMPTGQRGAAVRHFTRNGSPMISLEDSTVDILDFLKRTPIIHE